MTGWSNLTAGAQGQSSQQDIQDTRGRGGFL